MNLAEILKDSEYKLSQFKAGEVAWLEQSIFLKSSAKGDVPYIKCLVRGKDIRLTPEGYLNRYSVLFKILFEGVDALFY